MPRVFARVQTVIETDSGTATFVIPPNPSGCVHVDDVVFAP